MILKYAITTGKYLPWPPSITTFHICDVMCLPLQRIMHSYYMFLACFRSCRERRYQGIQHDEDEDDDNGDDDGDYDGDGD